MPVIWGKILKKSVVYTDGWKEYDHYRVLHSRNEFVRGKSRINGIENFQGFAKRRLARFNYSKYDSGKPKA